MKLRVAVIYGGRSGEHEVSIRSAESVMAAMDPEKYEVSAVLHRQGRQVGARAPSCPSPAPTPASTSSSRCCTAPSARTARVQGLLELAGAALRGRGRAGLLAGDGQGRHEAHLPRARACRWWST